MKRNKKEWRVAYQIHGAYSEPMTLHKARRICRKKGEYIVRCHDGLIDRAIDRGYPNWWPWIVR